MSLYNDICLIFMQNDLDKFIMYTDKGLELADKEQDKRMLAIFYGFSGIYHFYKANYDTAHSLYEKALEYAIKIEDKFLEAKLYSNIALLYSMKGDYHTEIEYNLKALSIYEKIDEKKTFITLLVNIGTTYRSLSEHKKALYYFDRANKLAEETNYNHGRLLVYYAYANVYYDKKDFDKSLEYYLKSEKISKEENNKHFEILCLQSLSTFYSEVEKYQDLKKAEEYANESLAIALEFGDPFRIRGSKRVLAHLYKQQQRYKDCDLLASEAWAIDSIDIDTSYGLASMIVISNIHLNNKEKAEYFFNKYIELNGEKNKKNLQETLIGLEVKYETEKKELQIASLEKEKQLYTWLGIGGVLFAITLGIVLWQNIRNIKKEKQLIATQSVMNGEMNERSRLARDLHDRLSGNLSAVKIELNNAESLLNISDKLDSCIDEIRRVAHNLMPVSLQHGVKAALEDFAAQFPNVHFHFFGEDSRLEERMEFVIYCCANELINNSLKHSEALNINLQLVQDDKHLTLTVQDDGRGYDEKAVKKGLGLQNIYDRVTSCNGKIDVVSSPDKGTETTIELKIK
ncbi:MAG: sensor histidine kinase [Prevotella sp.]|nr:sensor histidine kinase [Prevotella sp.]